MSDPTNPTATPPPASPEDPEIERIRDGVVDVLKRTYDPEIPVDIYELGLIYGVDVTAEHDVHVRMTLTSPMCPVAGSLPPEVKGRIEALPGVRGAEVEVVWEPPWTKDMMTEAAKLQLGLM